MKGANEYANLFSTGQYGRFYITSGRHARGRFFRVQILPEGEEAISNGSQNMCQNKNAVEVYGIVGGNPGWSEWYGWLHEGKWVDDFNKLVDTKKKEQKEKIDANNQAKQERINREKAEIQRLLKIY